MPTRCPKCNRDVGTTQKEGRINCPHCGAVFLAETQADTGKLPPRDLQSERATAGAPAPLRQFGRYEILGEVGRGGMGVVYRAYDPDLKRTVALKVLLAGEGASGEAIERFFREAASAAKLQHPNIVPIHELQVHRGRHYYTMDFIEGQPLDLLIAERRPDVRTGLEIVRKVAGALEHAHSRGVIHRDLKPANIIVSSDGEPKVTDFGLAKDLTAEEWAGPRGRLTGTGVTMGTPLYMAPEQAAGRSREVDARTDIYALGCVLYEILTGAPPFAGASPLETARMHVETEPPRPKRRGAAVAADLETICLQCLEKEPARRYSSAGALAEDIRRFLDGEPILARPPSMLYVLRRKLVRHRAVVLTGLVAAAGLAGLGVWSFVKVRRERARAAAVEQDEKVRQTEAARQAGEACEAGRKAVSRFMVSAFQPLPERERLLLSAEAEFRRALALVPRDPEATRGLRDAYLRHAFLATDMKNYRLADEMRRAVGELDRAGPSPGK